MKTTVTLHDFREAFAAIRPDNFSYEGLALLYDFFEELEADTGEEIELDVIAICCDFCESTPDEIRSDYSAVHHGADLLDWLNCCTVVCGETETTIVYGAF